MALAPVRAIAAGLVCASALACSKPQPPTVTPQSVSVTAIDAKAIHLSLKLSATNPNSVDIPVQGLDAHVIVNQKVDLGTVNVSKAFTLVAGKATPIDATVDVPWGSVVQLAQVGGAPSVPYTCDGNVSLGGDLLHVTVPYHLSGTITSQQLVGATLNSMVPGLNLPH